MSDSLQAAKGAGEDDIKRKLVLRVVFAGFLIAVLLGALAFIDYLGRPSDEAVSTGPTFSSPVPVPRKEVSQPVKSAEPAAVAEVPKPAPAAEASTAPATPVAPAAAVAAPVADTPARPEVAAQPELPRQDARSSPAPARASRAAGGNILRRRRVRRLPRRNSCRSPKSLRLRLRRNPARCRPSVRHRRRRGCSPDLPYRPACSPTHSMPRNCVPS